VAVVPAFMAEQTGLGSSVPGRGMEGDWTAFEQIDPFNNIRVEGFINRAPQGKLYGAMHILAVDGAGCDQFVWPTPKQQYPHHFDPVTDEMSICFPTLTKVKVYEKLDGTNILAYAYKAPSRETGDGDAGWRTVVSFKTRLQPFMTPQFVKLWKEVLEMRPDIPELVERNGCNLSFELYGRKNQHMVLYDTQLDAGLLFGVIPPGTDGEHSAIVAPDELDVGSATVPKLIRTIDGDSDMVRVYQELRAWLDDNLQVERQDDEIDIKGGLEGTVWYAYTDGELLQYKCKPELLLDSSFAHARSIPRHSIRTTVINAFEDLEDPDYDYIVSLLREEYSDEKIAKREFIIREVLKEITDDMAVRKVILEIYDKSGLNFANQKNQVMRLIAEKLLADVPKGPERKKLSKIAFKYLDRFQG